ncbi:MAG: hypothetical protein GY950_11570 [bacterium]|nr:hypothetical protein [bacterium]
MMQPIDLDPEVSAMNDVLETFKYLDHDQRVRVVDWVSARFNMKFAVVPEPVEVPAPAAPPAPAPVAPAPVTPVPPVAPVVSEGAEAVEPPVAPPVEQPAAVPAAAEVQPEPPPAEPAPPIPVEPEPTDVKDLKNFDNIEDLFLSSDAKRVSDRILLAAAYVQVKKNAREVTSYEINTQLRAVGYGVTNITTLINGLLKKTPPLMIITKKDGATKQARRKFRVTEHGIKTAIGFLI